MPDDLSLRARGRRLGLWACLYPGAVFLVFCGPAWSEWHGELKWTSEHAYRGYAMSAGKPSVQGNIEYLDDSGWYGGLTVSGESLDSGPGNGTSSWISVPRIGHQWQIGTDWRMETWAAGYLHEGKVEGKRADHVEIATALHYGDLLSAQLSIAPDAYGRAADLLSLELGAFYDLSGTLQASGGIGYSTSTADSNLEQGYWNAGVSWFITPNLVADFRFADNFATSYDAAEELAGRFYLDEQHDRFVLTLTFGF